ncbi:hypothetical protein LUZ60_010449 [Juncus effusus]|nr:hypothetical protein LUZ60_010449 [Juncus effusus]
MTSVSSIGLSSISLRAAPVQALPYVGIRKLSPSDHKAYGSFKQVHNSLKFGRSSGGSGALSVRRSVAGEIAQIALTMNGLVLVGVAVGFVLLRIEASLEESE